MRVFLDTNVLFSGLFSKRGAPGAIIDRFVAGEFDFLISEQVLQEVIAALKDKAPAILPLLNLMLQNNPPEIVPDPERSMVIKWKGLLTADDAVILAAAESARSDIFVTGDKHFFKDPVLSIKAGLKIITPAEFVALLDREAPP